MMFENSMVGFSSVLHPREAGSGGRQSAALLCPRWANGNHPSRPLAGEKRLRNRLSALVRNFLPFPENRNLWQGLSIARSSRNTENAPAGGLITLITHLFAVSREPVLGKGLSSITLKGLVALLAHLFLAPVDSGRPHTPISFSPCTSGVSNRPYSPYSAYSPC